MPIKAVCFDFGGVLVRTSDQTGRIAWEKKLGLAPGGLSKLVFDSEVATQATVGSVPETAIWEFVARELNLDLEEKGQLHEDFFSGDQLDQQLVGFLKSLRPRYKTAILSNAWSDARHLFIDKFHLDHVVDLLYISSEEKVAKPNKLFFERACDRLEVLPPEIAFVDDFEANIKGALSTGMHAILFKDPNQVIMELKKVLY